MYALFRDVPATAVGVPSILGSAFHRRNLPLVVLSRLIKQQPTTKLRNLSLDGALDVLLKNHQCGLSCFMVTIGGDDSCALSHSRLQFYLLV